MEHFEVWLPVGRDRIHESEQVCDAHVIDRRGVEVGCKSDAGERGVAAVTAAVDGDSLWIGDALLDQPLHAVGDVVLHLVAPLLESCLPELSPVAGRAAEIHLQHGVAAIGQELDLRIVAPAVARPRAAVRVNHHWQILRLPSRREREVAVDREAVARF